MDQQMTEKMPDSAPWFIEHAAKAVTGPEAKKHAPATLRNRDAIVDVLRDHLPKSGKVLELASGSGEHIVYFAQAFAALTWQPSDINIAACHSINAWREEADQPNIAPAIVLDVCATIWPVHAVDAILCINMVHISPWEASLATFAAAATRLPANGLLYFYGPYLRDDVMTSEGNLQFDLSLRSRDPSWGLRHVSAMDAVAMAQGFVRSDLVQMPANNISLIYRKT